MYPGDFGNAAMDCNCRCRATQRSKIALGKQEYQKLQERARFFGLMEEDSKEFGHEKEKVVFSDFKKNYLKAAKKEKIIIENVGKNDIITLGQYPEYSRIFRKPASGKFAQAVEDAQKTNPNFKTKAYEYTHNCQRCVPAWELRQRGFDVIARPCKPAGTHDAVVTSPFSVWQFNAFDQDKSKRVQADREGTGKEKIIEFLKAGGNGATV
jgi:hypothetical protein